MTEQTGSDERAAQDQKRVEADAERTGFDAAIGAALIERIGELSGEVASLNSRITYATSQSTFNKVVGVLVVALLGILAIEGYILYRVDNNASAIKTVQVRTSDRVLCPLYDLFIESIENAGPLAGDSDGDGVITTQEQKRYEHAVDVIFEGYETLNCN